MKHALALLNVKLLAPLTAPMKFQSFEDDATDSTKDWNSRIKGMATMPGVS